MAIYSLSIRTISRDPKRSDSRVKKSSAVAAVAYACTTSLTDQRTGTTYNYVHGNQKKVASTVDLGLYFPGGKMVIQERDRLGEYSDFWSKVELKEKRKDSRTARTIIAALPIEMTRNEHIAILEEYREFLASKYGLATQIAIHYDSPHNPHAHIIMPTRSVSATGELGEKIRSLDSQKTAHYEFQTIRESWAEICNQILEPKYHTRIDPRTLEAQGIDRQPEEHLGPAKWRIMQRELVELDQLEKEIREELSHVWKEEAGRRAVQPARSHGETGDYGEPRIASIEEARGGIQQGIEGSSRGKIGEPRCQASPEAARPVQPVGTQRPVDETPGEMRSSHSRDREKANFFPGDNRNTNRKNDGQAGSDHGRPTPTAKRGTSDAPRSVKRTGKPDHKARNNWQAESTLDKLIFLENKLEDLNEFFVLKQLQDKQQESLILRLDKALDNLQTLFELEALRRSKSHDTRSEQSDTAEPESSNDYRPRGPKA